MADNKAKPVYDFAKRMGVDMESAKHMQKLKRYENELGIKVLERAQTSGAPTRCHETAKFIASSAPKGYYCLRQNVVLSGLRGYYSFCRNKAMNFGVFILKLLASPNQYR